MRRRAARLAMLAVTASALAYLAYEVRDVNDGRHAGRRLDSPATGSATAAAAAASAAANINAGPGAPAVPGGSPPCPLPRRDELIADRADPPGGDAERADPFEAMNEEISRAAEILGASGSAEHRVAAAMLGRGEGPDRDPDFGPLQRAVAADIRSPLLALTWLAFCDRDRGAAPCRQRADERYAQRVAADNGAVWARIAERRMARRQQDTAFDALRRAVSAPLFDRHYGDMVVTLERGLAAATNRTTFERASMAFSLAVALRSGGGATLTRACRDEALLAEHGQTCVAYALRLERDGTDLLDVILGLEMQESLFRLAGKPVLADGAVARKAALLERLRFTPAGFKERFLFSHAGLLADYLDRLAIEGEVPAMAFLSEETERLLALDAYAGCRNELAGEE